MKKQPTQRTLATLVKRHKAFLARHGTAGRWESIPEAPWYRFTAPEPNPAWLQQTDLAGLDLRGLDLPFANLRLVRCLNQDLTGARLDHSLMREGIFNGTVFCASSLCNVDFTCARLARCDFTDADLVGAEFENAVLTDARIDWDTAGRGRFLVERVDGIATGGYGEMEQDYTWIVTDQSTRREMARFDGHSYQCFFSSDPIEYSGVVGVRITPDARCMVVTYANGRTDECRIPATS